MRSDRWREVMPPRSLRSRLLQGALAANGQPVARHGQSPGLFVSRLAAEGRSVASERPVATVPLPILGGKGLHELPGPEIAPRIAGGTPFGRASGDVLRGRLLDRELLSSAAASAVAWRRMPPPRKR
jgi:hypothetical protein